MELAELLEIEEIRRLKYRYMRCVDLHLWDELAECFIPEATCNYSDGKWACEGRDAIIDLLSNGLTSSIVSLHIASHPEIDLTGPTTAVGTWRLEDTVFQTDTGSDLHGAGYYHDEYVKVDGIWKIASTGYTRTFEHRSDGFQSTFDS